MLLHALHLIHLATPIVWRLLFIIIKLKSREKVFFYGGMSGKSRPPITDLSWNLGRPNLSLEVIG
jgi:hypothetical protein